MNPVGGPGPVPRWAVRAVRTTRPGRLLLLLSTLMTLAAVAACGSAKDALAPPDIVYGEDACAECGMILSEPRFAAASLVETQGRVEPLLFDDIGDMLGYHAARPELQVRRWYVHDYETEAWVDAEAAVFVRAPGLRTPMASHLAAFADAASAETFAAGQGQAEILRFADLVPASAPDS
jgi:copper chaperone NosL